MSEQFCTQCGTTIADDAQFCPKCGKAVEGRDAATKEKQQIAQFQNAINESRIGWLVFLLAIYSIPAIIIGLYYAIDPSAMANAAWNNESIKQWLIDNNITYDQLVNYFRYFGYIIIASGAMVLVSLICTWKRTAWKIAFIACMIGSFLCFFSIFGIIIGLLVAWMIYGTKDLYVNDKSISKT
jgi:hypothetical protein